MLPSHRRTIGRRQIASRSVLDAIFARKPGNRHYRKPFAVDKSANGGYLMRFSHANRAKERPGRDLSSSNRPRDGPGRLDVVPIVPKRGRNATDGRDLCP